MNNCMCAKCFSTVYFNTCEDFDQEYCAAFLKGAVNIADNEEVKI